MDTLASYVNAIRQDPRRSIGQNGHRIRRTGIRPASLADVAAFARQRRRKPSLSYSAVARQRLTH